VVLLRIARLAAKAQYGTVVHSHPHSVSQRHGGSRERGRDTSWELAPLSLPASTRNSACRSRIVGGARERATLDPRCCARKRCRRWSITRARHIAHSERRTAGRRECRIRTARSAVLVRIGHGRPRTRTMDDRPRQPAPALRASGRQGRSVAPRRGVRIRGHRVSGSSDRPSIVQVGAAAVSRAEQHLP